MYQESIRIGTTVPTHRSAAPLYGREIPSNTHDSVNSFGSSATCFEFVSAYVSFCFCFTMSWESFDLRPLAGFDGRVELLEKEAVWDEQFLHVRDENVMVAST